MDKVCNIIDYARGVRSTFAEKPFRQVDALILAQFSYLDFTRLIASVQEPNIWVSIASLYKAEEFRHMTADTFFSRNNRRLLLALCASPRYRNILMNFHENKIDPETEEQFSSVTYKLPTGEVVVAFRGTDPSLIGWKEDFNMLYLYPVPSQLSALRYLEQVAERTSGDMYVTGHSKGGNLAVYSVLCAKDETRQRVKRVYDLDGPGFPSEFLAEQKKSQTQKLVFKLRPEGSIVGVIFESTGKTKVVKCHKMGVQQHEAFNWQIMDDKFVASRTPTLHVKHMDKTLNALAYALDWDQRKIVVDTVFSLLSEIEVESLKDLAPQLMKEREKIFASLKDLDEETMTYIKTLLRSFLKLSFQAAFVRGDVMQKGLSYFE